MRMITLQKGKVQIRRLSVTSFREQIIFQRKINEIHIELYTDFKDLSVESKVESVLDKYGIFYDHTETWIESEKMYEVLYSFEMEA